MDARIFLGPSPYCMAALPAARSLPHPFAPVATVLGAMVLALVCVGCCSFSFTTSRRPSVSITSSTESRRSGSHDRRSDCPRHTGRTASRMLNRSDPSLSEQAVSSHVSGYIRSSIRDAWCRCEALPQSASRSAAGRPLCPGGNPTDDGLQGNRLPPEGTAELLAVFDFGPTRTLQQDVEFGVLQIVDIALKAISPAVNESHHRHQLHRSVEPHSDPLRVPRAAGRPALRSAGHRSRQHWMDPLRAPAGRSLGADPHVLEDGRSRQLAVAANPR